MVFSVPERYLLFGNVLYRSETVKGVKVHMVSGLVLYSSQVVNLAPLLEINRIHLA